MRIPSGKTDQLIYFVAVDSADHITRKTGLSAFTVYRSRNGAAATVYTTPTIAELSAANMPGVYSLAIDEDTTIGASSDSEEYAVHITCATMAPVTRTVELYRRDVTSGKTLTVTAGNRADADIGADSISLATAANLAVVAGYIDTEVAAILAAVDTEVAAIKAKTDNLPAAPAATGDIPTAAQNAAGLLDIAAGVETGLTVRQALRLMASTLFGKASGLETVTAVYRDFGDTKARVTATVDANGNRTAVTRDST